MLKPIKLSVNCRFLVGLLYRFHQLTLKDNIFIGWIRFIPMGLTFKANALFLENQRNSLSTAPLQFKHPKVEKAIYINQYL